MNVKRWHSRNNHARLLRASLRFGGEAALPGRRLNPWLPWGGRSKARGGRRRKSHARRGRGRGAQRRPRPRATLCDPVRPRAGLPRLPLPSATGTVGARAFRTEQNFRADVYTCASRGAAPEGEQEGGQGRRSSGVRERAGAGPPGRTRGVPAPSSWEAGSRPPPGHRLQRGRGELGDEGGRRHPQPERAVWPLLPPRTCPWPLEPAVGLWDAGPGCPPPHRPSAPRKLESPLECCLPRAPDSSRRGSPPQPRATLPGDAGVSRWWPTPTVAGVRPPSPGRRREMLP